MERHDHPRPQGTRHKEEERKRIKERKKQKDQVKK